MPETIIVSYSELDCFRQCPFKHQRAYRERWKPATVGPALAKGTLWHQVLEHHYKAIGYWQRLNPGATLDAVPEGLVHEIRREYLSDDDGGQTEFQELIDWMYDGYIAHYGSDPQWYIVAVEHAPTIWLPTDRGGRSRFKLKLKIDLIVREIRTDQLWLVDHKSGKDLPRGKQLELDDQFGLYTWAMHQLGMPVLGSIHSAARTQRNKDQDKHFQPLNERFARKPMYRTDIEIQNLAVEAYRAAKRAYAIPLGEADRATDPDRCSWRCDFTEPCLASRKGMDLVQFLEDKGFVQDFTRH